MVKLSIYLAIVWLFIRRNNAVKVNFTLESALNVERYDGVLFPIDFCNIVCLTRIHTLCETEIRHEKDCNGYKTFNLKEIQKMKTKLIIGHNGLRNRIAERLSVANMVELIWDDTLAEMAEKHVKYCKPYEDDECTRLDAFELFRLIENRKQILEASYRSIVQNRYYLSDAQTPGMLIQNALRHWYNEKDYMHKPYIVFDHALLNNIIRVEGENNFTHLSSPETMYFGCAFNRVYHGFLLVCNYYPYKRTFGDYLTYMYGPPGSLCPIYRPLRSKSAKFYNLCYGLTRNLAANKVNILHFWSFIYVLITFIKTLI